MLGLEEQEKERREMGLVEDKLYPAPLALHEDVINNPTLFMETLRHFHTTLGTRFMYVLFHLVNPFNPRIRTLVGRHLFVSCLSYDVDLFYIF